MVDVATDEVRVVPESRFGVGEPYGYVAWAPDGRTVYFTGDNGVRAYGLTDDVVSDLPFPGTYYSVAAVPAPDRSTQCPNTLHPWQIGPGGPNESGDGLPPTGAASEPAALDAVAGGLTVRAEPGRAWTRTDSGAVEIVPEMIYTIVETLQSAEDCPDAPSFGQLPLTYLVDR